MTIAVSSAVSSRGIENIMSVRTFAQLLSNFRFRSRRRSRRSRTLRNPQLQRLQVEHLESRRLLSANQISYDSFVRAVVIEGTAGSDFAKVWTDASLVHVQLQNQAGVKNVSFSRASVDWVRFSGADG